MIFSLDIDRISPTSILVVDDSSSMAIGELMNRLLMKEESKKKERMKRGDRFFLAIPRGMVN